MRAEVSDITAESLLILKTDTYWLNYFSKNKMYDGQFLVKTKMLIYS